MLEIKGITVDNRKVFWMYHEKVGNPFFKVAACIDKGRKETDLMAFFCYSNGGFINGTVILKSTQYAFNIP